jgi:superfamily II DNA or RNA helicase
MDRSSDLTKEQKQAYGHIWKSFSKNKNPICSINTGGGKTKIACKIIYDILENSSKENLILIVIKPSTYESAWVKEIDLWRFSTHYIHGKNRKEDTGLCEHDTKYFFSKSIYLTSYGTLSQDINNNLYNLSIPFDLIVFDEIHTIMNFKKPTKISKTLTQLKADKKLALTATPVQNDRKDLGLIYLFLNEDRVTRDVNELENAAKICLQDDLIDLGILEDVSQADREYSKIEKILSLPIHKDMLSFIRNELKGGHQLQMQYLSCPASVYKYCTKTNIPSCTKQRAVEIILSKISKLNKVIIFSRYRNVIRKYKEFCKKLGFNVISVTGDDKPNAQKDKLNLFEKSSDISILLTTLQKSAEGFN